MPQRNLTLLNLLTLGIMLIATGLVFFYAPTEREMGEVQRVFYFHVAAGWIGGLAFFVTLVTGILYLRTNNSRWDMIGYLSVEIGLVFSLINIISGSIWARPIWNTWWTWDPRLTTVTILVLVYVAYIMLRQSLEDPERRARFAAVYGIIGFISVPLTFFSIRIWRTIHPVVIGSGDPEAQGQMNMTPAMRFTFIFALIAFTVLYACLLANRLRLEQMAQRVEQLKLKILSA